MKIAVVDDEKEWRVKAYQQIQKYYEQQQTKAEIHAYASGEAFIRHGKQYDILFADIEMPGMDGFGMADTYNRMNHGYTLMILTTHTEMSRKGYMVNAFRYIDKMNMEMEIQEALEAAEKKMKRNEALTVSVINLGNMKVVIKDILYVETTKRNILLHTVDNEYTCNGNLSEMEEVLKGAGFFRCHKSYIVNLDAVKTFDNVFIYLMDGSKVYVSARKYVELKRQYLQRKFETANS